MQPSTYMELLRLMGELSSAGERGQRQMLTAILPRLAQMENLPASLIPQLLQILSTGSDRSALTSRQRVQICSDSISLRHRNAELACITDTAAAVSVQHGQ